MRADTTAHPRSPEWSLDEDAGLFEWRVAKMPWEDSGAALPGRTSEACQTRSYILVVRMPDRLAGMARPYVPQGAKPKPPPMLNPEGEE